ncbi:MAG: ribonuclease R [Pseudomonadota bacterium]
MAELPTKAAVLAWIADHPHETSKRDIARAFGIKGAQRIDLKRLLKELEVDGQLEKRRKTYRDPEKLPPVSVCEVLPASNDGDLFARPLEWTGEGPEPVILILARGSDPALGAGDRILARLTEVSDEDHAYEARFIRKIGTTARRVLGVFRSGAEGGRIVPIDKKSDTEWRVAPGATQGAKDGELVEAEPAGPKTRLGLPAARVLERLGDPMAPKAVSLIAIHQHGIPDTFPDAALGEADAAQAPEQDAREDLGQIPFVTIDPPDARDRDDAVAAWPDRDPKNPGGHVVWVAIADVAHFVRPDSALEREARKRGNSTYFPDRVVPMLPDRLSGDLCSLHADVERAVLAVKMVLDKSGKRTSHSFHRGMIQSRASLTYADAQSVDDKQPTAAAAPFQDALTALFAAWRCALGARTQRQPLALELPEREIILTDAGRVQSVNFKDRLNAHKLIEEFMVLANVAAAETLKDRATPLLYRVHEEPDPERLDALRETVQSAGLVLAKGQVLKTAHLNRLLDAAADTDAQELINMATLRSMQQAYYHPENFGHFGLDLVAYAHFTSPIRRYSDLITHRALISAHGWGPDGLQPAEVENLEATSQHISLTERRSMMAERDTTDRYLAAFLSERVGDDMSGRVSGVMKFGVFVRLDENGADGLVPVRSLGREYFVYDRREQTLMGEDSGTIISVGMPVSVRVARAAPLSGGLELELLSIEGQTLPRNTGRSKAKARPRKPALERRKSQKTSRKITRRRR